LHDKFHNSQTNHLETFILAAQLLGPDFRVRDTQSGTVYSGPDLAQLAVNSPKGVRMFITHAYDRNGIYWEMSASYTGYTFNYFEHILTALTGYSDPPGYRPGPGVRDFYRPLRDFQPGRELPEFWRAVLAQPRLSMNSGDCLPVNDARANPTSSQHLELWAKLLGSERLARAAAGVRQFEGKPARGPADPWPPVGSTLMPAAGQATLRGPENRVNLHCDWHPMSDYHSHHDPLNLILSAEKHLLLFDLGYHLGHPLRSLVTDRTAAHNTVTVDRENSIHHRKGVLHHYLGAGPVQFLDASVPEAYPQCDRYRRALVLVGDHYLVDIFRVRGGTRHDYTLLSYAAESRCSLPLKDYPGSLADLRKRYRGYQDLEDDFPNVAGPYQLIHRPRIGKGREGFTVDWPHKGRPDLSLRVHHLNGRGAEVMLARVPFRLRYQGRVETTSEMLIVSRTGRPGLKSTFISVLEPRSRASKPLAGTRRLPLESPDPDAVAVRVDTADGYDIIINGRTDGPHRLAEAGLTLHGKLAVLRRRAGRPGVEVTLYGSRLEGPGLRLAAPPVRSGRVAGIDLARGELTLDEPLPGASQLAGRFILVRGRTGETDRWLVRSAEGRTIRLDLDHSRLLVMEGRVDRVIDRMAFLTGIDFPEPPRPGTPVRFGPAGDFSCPRYHLLMTSQSGNPTRYRLTTCFEIRRYLFGFNREADLRPEFEGRPFWSSAIEIGDDIFTEPYLNREVAGKTP
ncbi:MAG TPA: heparinase II/III family protein, partial [bacterium]|nr:heparinase II/III family protein [bacterium]